MMATTSKQANKKEKKLLLSKLFTVGWELREVEVPETMTTADGKVVPYKPKYRDTVSGAWSAYQDQMKVFFKASLYFIIFLLPFLVLIFYGFNAIQRTFMPENLNFLGNLGVGYPGNAADLTATQIAVYNGWQMFFYYCIPAIFILSFGIAGLFNVAKKAIWNEPMKIVAKPFFNGIKLYWPKMVLPVMAGSGAALAMAVALLYHLKQTQIGLASAGSWCACILTFIFGAVILLYCMVMMTLIPSYKLSFKQLLCDSLVLAVNKFLPFALVGLLTALPILLLALFSSNIFFTALIIFIVAMFGVPVWAMLWTGVGHSSYLKCVFIHEQGAAQQAKKAVTYTQNSGASKNKKKSEKKAAFQNPKKKKKK